MFKTTMMLMFSTNRVKLYCRIGKRYFIRNKIINKTLDILNEDIANEIVHYLGYNHDPVMNAYVYVIIYELLYISVWIHFKPKRKLLEQAFLHIVVYMLVKEHSLPLLGHHIP